jgi:rod shape-determining protein MreD
LPLLAILAVIQSTLLSHLRLLDGRPDLVLLAVLAWALAGRVEEAMVWGLAGGLFLDLLSGVPFGTSAIALVLIAFLLSLTEGRLWGAHPLMPLAAALVASAVYYSLMLGALLLAGQPIDLASAGSRVILPSTFLNLVLAIPAVQLAGGLRQALYPPEVKI